MNSITTPTADDARVSERAKISAPGVYDMPADVYHNDPCETPSLSAGMINDLLIAPAKCFKNSRRLNPDWEEPEAQEKFTIGAVAHVMFLEPELFEQKVVVLPFTDWRKEDAKLQRDAARAHGKTPILAKHMEKVLKARKVFFAHGFTGAAFVGGRFEQSMFWRHPVHGFWCRARPDFVADSLAHLNDYKATANADPVNFGKHAYQMGYYRRAAWYLEGAEMIFGKRPDHYWFCNQEIKAPYLTSVVELDWRSLEDGKAENDHAASIFDRCLRAGEWYGYRHPDSLDRDRAFQVALPSWAGSQIDERLRRVGHEGWTARRMVEQEEV